MGYETGFRPFGAPPTPPAVPGLLQAETVGRETTVQLVIVSALRWVC